MRCGVRVVAVTAACLRRALSILHERLKSRPQIMLPPESFRMPVGADDLRFLALVLLSADAQLVLDQGIRRLSEDGIADGISPARYW